MYLSMVCGMLMCVSLSINVCMFTVSNALLLSNARYDVGPFPHLWYFVVVECGVVYVCEVF